MTMDWTGPWHIHKDIVLQFNHIANERFSIDHIQNIHSAFFLLAKNPPISQSFEDMDLMASYSIKDRN